MGIGRWIRGGLSGQVARIKEQMVDLAVKSYEEAKLDVDKGCYDPDGFRKLIREKIDHDFRVRG